MNALVRTAGIVIALFVGASATHALRVRTMDHFLATQTDEDVYYLPPSSWLPSISLGYREALADLIWMRALVYFGEEIKRRGDVSSVFAYGDAIRTLDPQFKPVYRWVGTASLYKPVPPTLAEYRRTVAFLRDGAEQFPDDGKMAWDVAATILYELLPNLESEDEKLRMREIGSEYLVTAARLGGGPEWINLAATSQLERLGQMDRALHHLEEIEKTVSDPVVRARARSRIAALRGQAFDEASAPAWEALERDRARDYPYLSPTLYLLVGPPWAERLSDDPKRLAFDAGPAEEPRPNDDAPMAP